MTTNKTIAQPGFLADMGLRLLLFGGKGGVGKTTCAAATALHLAAQTPANAYLLVSTDPAHSLADSFAGGVVANNLTLREIDPQASLSRFRLLHQQNLRTIALRGTFLDEADISQLLDLSMPGMDEMMALLEIVTWVRENRYACIVVDTAPAGHTLRLLGLPELMRKWLLLLDSMLEKHRFMVKLFNKFYKKDSADLYLENMASDLRYLQTLFHSSAECRFVPVMLAEQLSVHVTRQMLEELALLQIPVHELLINRLVRPQPSCEVCVAREAIQFKQLGEIVRTFIKHELWGLPLLLEETRGLFQLDALWAQLQPLDAWLQMAGTCSGAPAQSAGFAVATGNPVEVPSASTRLLMFAGKGGVGKTTLACATALRLAEVWPQKEILLVSIDPAHSLSACLGYQMSTKELRLARGLTVLELDCDAEFAHFKKIYSDEIQGIFTQLSTQAHVQIEFEQKIIERLMETAPPGLDEMLAITRIVELLDENRYDLFILDTAPTGHLLRFLETPELIESWLKTFFRIFLKYRRVFVLPRITQVMVVLSKQIKIFRRILTDSSQAALMAVTIPTEMAYEETQNLVSACQRLQVAVPALFVNLVTPADSCSTCSALRRGEEQVLNKYRNNFQGQMLTTVYRQPSVDPERLSALGQSLYQDNRPSQSGKPDERGRTLCPNQ